MLQISSIANRSRSRPRLLPLWPARCASGSLKTGESQHAQRRCVASASVYRAAHGIGAFRVNSSQILPVKTHPQQAYAVGDLSESAAIVAAFEACGSLARRARPAADLPPRPVYPAERYFDPEIVRRSVSGPDLSGGGRRMDPCRRDQHPCGRCTRCFSRWARLAAALASLPAGVRALVDAGERRPHLHTGRPADFLREDRDPVRLRRPPPSLPAGRAHRVYVTARARATGPRAAPCTSLPQRGLRQQPARPAPYDFIDPDDFPEEAHAGCDDRG